MEKEDQVEEAEDRAVKDEDFELPKLYTSMLVDQEKSSYTPTVRGKILQCLGVLAGYGKNTFLASESQYKQLLSVFVNAVKDQVIIHALIFPWFGKKVCFSDGPAWFVNRRLNPGRII